MVRRSPSDIAAGVDFRGANPFWKPRRGDTGGAAHCSLAANTFPRNGTATNTAELLTFGVVPLRVTEASAALFVAFPIQTAAEMSSRMGQAKQLLRIGSLSMQACFSSSASLEH